MRGGSARRDGLGHGDLHPGREPSRVWGGFAERRGRLKPGHGLESRSLTIAGATPSVRYPLLMRISVNAAIARILIQQMGALRSFSPF